ncbi:MAG: glutathione peroxidase [Candidimonas sp.]
MTNAYSFSAALLDGTDTALSRFRGDVLLIVNVASECGFTPQYAGLQELHSRYHRRGFSVLAFPCNQFGAQEPGDAQAIGEFCDSRYHVRFPVFQKIDANGKRAHPLFAWLAKEKPGVLGTERIKWNFTKFLVDRQGRVAHRYAPATPPEKLGADIEALLDESPVD